MKRAVLPSTGVVTGALLWGAIAVASAALWPIYRSSELITLIVVSLIAGSIVVVVALWRQWSFIVTLVASFVVFVVIGVPVAVPSEAQNSVLPTLAGLADLLSGIALGWKQLLTISLPVGSYQALLVPALILVFGATVVSLTIALRSSRPELSVIAPVVVFVVAVAFGPTYPERPLLLAIALLIVVALILVWFRWQRRRDSVTAIEATTDSPGLEGRKREFGFAGLRTLVSASVILAIATTIAIGVTTELPPNNDRSVLRSAIVEPFDPQNYVSPLSGYRRYWQPATASAVLFEIAGVPLGTRVRLATLDSYDGVVYAVGSGRIVSESGSFARVPSRIDQSGTDGDSVAATITIADYSGVWLPTVGLLEEINFDGPRAVKLRDSFYYNGVSGTAAVVDELQKGDRYTLTGVAPNQPGSDDIASFTPGNAQVPRVREAPDELTEKLDQYVRGVTEPGERLAAMLAGLATDGYVSHGVGVDEPPSRSGHSADRVAELFTAPRMIGDGEQYAVAASLMADELGFPSRVVLGFVTADQQVRGNDISAWIEVNTEEYGWVTLDPNPAPREIPDEDPDDIAQVARPQTIVEPPEINSESPTQQSNPDSEQALRPDLDPLLRTVLAVVRVLGWSLLALLTLVAPFLLIVAAKARRRLLRRRAVLAVQRVSGGWRQFEDSMLDAGYSPPSSGTRTEIAALVQTPAAQDLAADADRLIFSDVDPLEEEVETLWSNVIDLERQLHVGLSRWARIKTKISLRSLGGYSVTSLFKR